MNGYPKGAGLMLAGGLCLMLVLTGCNTLSGTPSIEAARIDPPELRPGDTAIITLEVRDKHAVVERIEGVVEEDPRITLPLRDDGVAPDVKADDNIWSLQVDVPLRAPAGSFTLEFTAYRNDGMPVPVRDEAGEVTSLGATLPVVIRYEQP